MLKQIQNTTTAHITIVGTAKILILLSRYSTSIIQDRETRGTGLFLAPIQNLRHAHASKFM